MVTEADRQIARACRHVDQARSLLMDVLARDEAEFSKERFQELFEIAAQLRDFRETLHNGVILSEGEW